MPQVGCIELIIIKNSVNKAILPRKPQEAYRPRRNLSKHNLSGGGVPQSFTNWEGVLIFVLTSGTPLLYCPVLGYPPGKGPGTSHWGTTRPPPTPVDSQKNKHLHTRAVMMPWKFRVFIIAYLSRLSNTSLDRSRSWFLKLLNKSYFKVPNMAVSTGSDILILVHKLAVLGDNAVCAAHKVCSMLLQNGGKNLLVSVICYCSLADSISTCLYGQW